MTKLLTLVIFLSTISFLHAQDALPIKVTFRESLLKHGTFVAQFRNLGDKNLLLHVEIDRADASERKKWDLLVTANHLKEIGKDQGWVVKSTDQIKVTSEGYQDLAVHMP